MGLTYEQLFPGRFIRAGEINGKAVTLTIKDVYLDTLEQEDGTEKAQAIVSFNEIKREWALNKTNAQCLVALWGRDSGDWIGHKVTLYPERDQSGLSDSGLCLRIKGSPDITKPVTATIKLPRRRPVTRKLVPTAKDAADVTVDDETGEVVADEEPVPGMDATEYARQAFDAEEESDEQQQQF